MTLALAFGLTFDQLHSREGLARVDAAFLDALTQRDPSLAARLADARRRVGGPDALPPRDESELLIALGPALDAFVARLFGIEAEWSDLRQAHEALAPLFRAKWKFVKRQAALRVPPEAVDDFDPAPALARLGAWIGTPLDATRFDELAFARAVLDWQTQAADKTADAATRDAARERVALALRYSAWAVHTAAGRLRHDGGVLFRLPGPVDALAPPSHVRARTEPPGIPVHRIDVSRLRRREGFDLTEPRPTLARGLDEANYCLLCHAQGTDSCSRGLRDKGERDDGDPSFRRSATGAVLAGCPLDERISEFQALKKDAWPIAALAMIAIDNPMLPATGHRICNDCMKACIYQAQTPVDIPRAETRTLEDVLALPWGVEIYALLTRWNPLDLRRPLPRPPSGRTVLVAGMGPAGFTLAHHLLNDGHAVVGIDGLKIEPLPAGLAGPGFAPVEDVESLRVPLSERTPGGFGGVAEYGITARWDKNYLTLIRLLLERRAAFALYGGVRLGGTLTLDDAFALGVDHVALAMGAGRPAVPELPGGLARGVRTASDFLMALQSTGAARADSIAALQMRLPVVVIGGGLTAVDTATEALAYYPLQVERFLARHEALVARDGEDAVRARWRADERATADAFIAHARALRDERAAAAAQGRPARVRELLQRWGGVTIAYRRALTDSPACRLNPEELEKALEEGVAFAEHLTPVRFEVDADGAVQAAVFARGSGASTPGPVTLPARSVLVAAGTRPNTVLAREFPDALALDGEHFVAIDEAGHPAAVTPGQPKPAQPRVLTALRADGRGVSFFGDLHPSWSGNVVRAMGSAKRGYPVVSALLARRAPAHAGGLRAIVARLDDGLRARVERIERLGPSIVEVVVRAPFAARRFEPGQFYRLQDFERDARRVTIDDRPTRLAMEGLALTGAWVDRDAGRIGTIVLEMGGSSNLCADLVPGQPVVLMGPTGTPTEIPRGRAVVLVGGGLGNAVLFSIGAACRAAGCTVLYFAGYRRASDRFRVEAIEAAADAVVWCCDEAPGFSPGRPQDRAFTGNVVDAMRAWADGALGALPVGPGSVEHLLAIGSDRMMAAVAAARHGPLAGRLNPAHRALGSINSPMQCMLKEICGQCLQRQVDPSTGVARYVFSCFEQDQPLDAVDFAGLDQRLRQNALLEAQTAGWIRLCRQAARPPV